MEGEEGAFSRLFAYYRTTMAAAGINSNNSASGRWNMLDKKDLTMCICTRRERVKNGHNEERCVHFRIPARNYVNYAGILRLLKIKLVVTLLVTQVNEHFN